MTRIRFVFYYRREYGMEWKKPKGRVCTIDTKSLFKLNKILTWPKMMMVDDNCTERLPGKMAAA